MLFKLIGRTNVFEVVHSFRDKHLGIPCVHGVTLDGKWQTTARVDDVEILPDTFLNS